MLSVEKYFILLLYYFYLSQKNSKATYAICNANMKPFYSLHWSQKYYLQTFKMFLSNVSSKIHL